MNGLTKGRFIPPYFFVLQELLSFCRDIAFPFSRHVLLSPLFRSFLVGPVGLDLPCFLSHSVADRLGLCCLFGGLYSVFVFRGILPLVDGPTGWRIPRLFLVRFPSSHFRSDVRLFIEWASPMRLHLDQQGCVLRLHSLLQFHDDGFEDICICCLCEIQLGSSGPLVVV